MPAFLANYLLFFGINCKNAVFALRYEISIAKVMLRLNLVRKCRSTIAEFPCASTESKNPMRKLRCASEIQKN